LDISIDQITQKLEDEGVEKFNKPFEKLLQAIEGQKAKVK
jgi:transaldolase/transaldolase/glucose-6-phosphate isomerase